MIPIEFSCCGELTMSGPRLCSNRPALLQLDLDRDYLAPLNSLLPGRDELNQVNLAWSQIQVGFTKVGAPWPQLPLAQHAGRDAGRRKQPAPE